MAGKSASKPYSEKVEEFAQSGARLVRESVAARYNNSVPSGTRLLEPGFIPPRIEAKVLIVSYFPNETDLDEPGSDAYDRVRRNYERWGDSGAADAYGVAYDDWLGNLGRIPFHRARVTPVLDRVGLQNEDIAWLPLIKVPMKAGSLSGVDLAKLIEVDIHETWAQIFLLQPKIVWIQGVAIGERISNLVRERITERILPIQSLTQQKAGEMRRSV